jgi:hypothetical protein
MATSRQGAQRGGMQSITSNSTLGSRTSSAALAVALLMALAPGCGGGGGSTPGDQGMGDTGQTPDDLGQGCPSGTQDVDGDDVCEPDCASTACDNGTCTESVTTGLAECACNPGFQGATCDALIVPSATGVAFWIDADDASAFAFHSGNAVQSWADAGDGALSGTSASMTTAPTRVANALGGRTVVRFDGVDDQLSFADFDALSQSEGTYTMFLVMRASSGGTGSVLGSTGASDVIELRSSPSGGMGEPELSYLHDPVTGMDATVAADASYYGGAGYSVDEFHLVTIQRTRESLSVWMDANAMVGTWDSLADILDQRLTETLTLLLSPSSDALAMDLAEMIVVSDDLHFGQRRPYEDYLGAKWFGEAFTRNPTAFGEASVWLDASDAAGLTTASGAVTGWANRGVDGGFFANGSFAASRPTLVASGLGGLPVVRFDGGDALGQNEVFVGDGPVSGEYALVMVLSGPASGDTQLAMLGLHQSDEETAFRFDVMPDDARFAVLHRTVAGLVTTHSTDSDTSGAHIVVIERSTSGQLSVRVDGTTTSVAGNADADLLASDVNWSLGGVSPAAPANGLIGDVAEVIRLENTLGAAEEEALMAMLEAKWGL